MVRRPHGGPTGWRLGPVQFGEIDRMSFDPATDNPFRDAVRRVHKLRTQRNIAKRVGVRHEALNRFLKGKQALSPKSLAALRRALDDIDTETARALSTVPRSPNYTDEEIQERGDIIDRVTQRLQKKEMEELRRLLERLTKDHG